MDARKGNIYEILNGNKQFLIPVYQRYYSWDIEQCKRLWNDIVEMQKKGKVGHFVGSIVNIAEQAMPTGVQKYMIIDGQQRMTTLSLLLLALRDYAINNPEDTTINARRIDNMLLKNEYESGDERYKLLLTETDRDILMRLVEEKPIPDDTRSKLLDNYKFFAGKIAEKVKGLPDGEAPAPVEVEGVPHPYRGYYQPRDRKGVSIDIRKVKSLVSDACDDCKICADVCPMGSISHENVREYTGICIKCGACIKKCPKQARYYEDEGYLYHQHELEEGYTRRAAISLFL